MLPCHRWKLEVNQTTAAVFSRHSWSYCGGPFTGFAGLVSTASSYAAACTPRAARPDGSGFLDHAASHSTAFAVLHATLGPPGTVALAAFYPKIAN